MRVLPRSSIAYAIVIGSIQAFTNRKLSCSVIDTNLTCTKSPVLEKYNVLEEKLKEIGYLEGARSLLGWDTQVMMKTGSALSRDSLNSALTAVIYDKQTSNELGQLIEELVSSNLTDLPSDYEKANVRDSKRDFDYIIRKPKELAVRESELEGIGYQTWVKARQDNSFSSFVSVLNEIISIKKEISKVCSPHLSLYDGNIDLFERGLTTKRLNEIFDEAKREIIPLIKTISETKKASPYVMPKGFCTTN